MVSCNIDQNNSLENEYFLFQNIDSKSCSTPHYNALILQDLVMNENDILLKDIVDANQNIQDALILLKIWLTQKHLGVSSIFTNNLWLI